MGARRIPPEKLAQARALLLAGEPQASICKETGISAPTLSRIAASMPLWRDALLTAPVPPPESTGGVPSVTWRARSLNTELDLITTYFRSALAAMINQAEVFGDPEWCRRQDADKLGTLHGILGDKLAGIATTAKALGLIGPPPSSVEQDALESGEDPEAEPETHRNGAVDTSD